MPRTRQTHPAPRRPAAPRQAQTTDPAQAVWPVVEEVEVGAAGEGKIAFVAEPIAASDIVATHDVDVVVCGLGPAGDAAALANRTYFETRFWGQKKEKQG